MKTHKGPMTELEEAYTQGILTDVYDEVLEQVDKWGVQTRSDGTADTYQARIARTIAKQVCDFDEVAAPEGATWFDILAEEVAEARCEDEDLEALETELIQVAAVCVSWLRDLRMRGVAE